MIPRRTSVAAVLVAVGLAGCAFAQESPLTGEWHVEDIGGAGTVEDSSVTLDFFEPGKLAGAGSCNRYTTSIAQDAFKVGPVASTMMMCDDALMEQERAFFAALELATRYETDAAGALRLFAGDGTEPVIVARRR